MLTFDGGGGGFEARYVIHVFPGFAELSGKGIGHGTGDYEGQKVKFSFEGELIDVVEWKWAQ